MSPQARIAHIVSLILYFGLLGLVTLTTFWPDPVEGASKALMLTIKLVPLLIVLPGLLKGGNKAYIWLCFILMIYFTDASVRAYLTQWEVIPVILMSLTVLLFLTSLIKIRAPKQA
ncbi:DUF2069 domain-containing protein [Marinobacteraceae bacterium S3BR75-40.1]